MNTTITTARWRVGRRAVASFAGAVLCVLAGSQAAAAAGPLCGEPAPLVAGGVTVGSVVSVKDSSWQSAIESFLGRNRHALVVAYGREREAVRLLRTAPRPLFEVTIVQPSHLRDDLKRSYDATTVASLLESSNSIVQLANR